MLILGNDLPFSNYLLFTGFGMLFRYLLHFWDWFRMTAWDLDHHNSCPDPKYVTAADITAPPAAVTYLESGHEYRIITGGGLMIFWF